MTRSALLVLASLLLVACGGDDDGGGGGLLRANADASAPGDAGAPRDAATDGGGAAATEAGADAGGALGPEHSGEATYYDADGTGACGFAPSTDFMVAAMNGAEYSKAVCGECVEVTGPLGKVVVRIVDLCPGCKAGGLDLSQTAFSKIAKLSDGRVKITWHVVACP